MEMGKENFNNSYWGTSKYCRNEHSASKKERSLNILRKGILISFLVFYFTSCGSRKVLTQNNSNISTKKEAFLASDGIVNRARRLEKDFVRSTGNLGSLCTSSFHPTLYSGWSALCVRMEMCSRAPSSFSVGIVY